MIYDLIIIGGGPAGVGAGVYAARKRLKTVVIAKEVSGQSSVSEDIQNWIGSISISGTELSKNLKAHLLAYANDVLELKEGELVEKIEKNEKTFKVKTNKNLYESKTVLIATGSRRRKLNIKGAEIFDNKGITYCASCDGPMFAGMDVAVIGGGNAGFGTASQLLAYVKSLTLFEHNEDFKAEAITVKNVLANPKMKGLTGVELLEIKGDKFVNAIVYREVKTGKTTELPIQGIFVEIGAVPATDFAKGLVEMDNFGKIIIDQKNQQTSEQGVWSAGDCTNTLYNQNNIAVGDAVRALEDIYMYLQSK